LYSSAPMDGEYWMTFLVISVFPFIGGM
jgi:hypothetical protein